MKRKILSVLLVLVLVLSFSLVTAVPVAAAEVNVAPESSIQAAIIGATSGDTIILTPGVYAQGDILINKPLTIQGAGKSATIIDATGFSLGLSIAADDVTIEGLTVQGATNRTIVWSVVTVSGTVIRDVEMSGAGSSGLEVHHSTVTDILVEDCDFTDNHFGLHFSSGITVTGFTVDGCTFAINDLGIYTESGISGLTVTGSSFSGGFAGMEMGLCPTFENILIEDSHFSGSVYGLYFWAYAGGEAENIRINYCSFIENLVGIEFEDNGHPGYEDAVIDAENNWWDSANGPENAGNTFNVDLQGATVSDYVDYVPWLNALGGESFAPVALDGTEDFSSIQAAITAATGSTITCAAGAYDEDVTIDKSLTLVSVEGKGSTIINGQLGVQAAAVRVADGVDDVVIGDTGQGFTINAAGLAAIYIVGSGVGNDNITVRDNRLVAADSNNALLTGGLQTNHTIADNEFAGNASQLVYVNGEASLVGRPSSGVDFTGNDFQGDALPGGVGLGQEATDSTISGNTFATLTGYAVLELWGDGNTVTGNDFTGDLPTGGLYLLDNPGTQDIDAVLASNSFLRAVVVERSGSSKLPKIWAYIQDAVNAAVTGDIVEVEPGTYVEGDIHINKSVTIKGAGRSSTTTIDATGKNAGFYIDTDNVTIKDLIVKNAIYRNITVYSTTVSNVTIDNVASLDSLASGLEVHHSTVNNLVINNSLFSGNALHGMRVDSAGVVNGMTITDSHFDGNDAGMTVYGDTDDVVISNSTFNNNVAQTGNPWTGGYGLYIGNCNGSTKTNTDWLFDECQFKDNHYDHPNYPSVITFSHGIALSPYMAGSIISNMTILNSEFSGNQKIGFRAFSVSATDVSAITIEYCDFIGMVRGISLTGEGATDFQVHYCNIDGNSEYGISNSSPMINALYNWWGDETGPEHTTLNTGAQGDAVSNNIDFSPWLYKIQENFIPGAPCYAGSVVLDNEATLVEETSYAGGWNTFSTPILLDSSADSVSKLRALVDGSDFSIVRAQRYDPVEGWVLLIMEDSLVGEDYQINPGEGVFIQVKTKGSLPILCSMELFWPQTRELSQGWNLVGAPSYLDKVVEDNILLGAATVVNSPSANPASWSYPPAYGTKKFLPGRAYWVAMSADATLMCFDGTPVADNLTWHLNQ